MEKGDGKRRSIRTKIANFVSSKVGVSTDGVTYGTIRYKDRALKMSENEIKD